MSEIWNHRRDFFGRMGTMTVWNPQHYADSYGGHDTAPEYGFAEGENIGIRDLPQVSLGHVLPQSVSGVGAAVLAGAVLSTVAGSGAGGGQSYPSGPGIPASVDPYPDYQGEVTPESHPELFEPPLHIPSPREVYETSIGIPEGENEGGFFIPVIDNNPDPYERIGEDPMPTVIDAILGGLSAGVDVLQGQSPGGTIAPTPVGFAPSIPAAPSATAGSQYYVNAAGKVVCRKRRRRRRLLTESDFNDLMRIATLPNKQNVTVALAKAVGRR